MNFLNGYKTYIAAALVIVLSGLKATGKIDENTFQILIGLAGSLGLIGLRSAMK